MVLTKPRGHASHGRTGSLELNPAGHTTGKGVANGQYSPLTHGRMNVAFNGQKYVAGQVMHVKFATAPTAAEYDPPGHGVGAGEPKGQ